MRVARWARCACVWHGGRGVQDNADGGIQDSTGYVLPPFIVVERGESLNEWVDRVAPDFVTSMFVLCHVTKRLQLLHSAGLCHRDLKPGNILWRPTANAWTLIDFGCAEPIGAPPPPLPRRSACHHHVGRLAIGRAVSHAGATLAVHPASGGRPWRSIPRPARSSL